MSNWVEKVWLVRRAGESGLTLFHFKPRLIVGEEAAIYVPLTLLEEVEKDRDEHASLAFEIGVDAVKVYRRMIQLEAKLVEIEDELNHTRRMLDSISTHTELKNRVRGAIGDED